MKDSRLKKKRDAWKRSWLRRVILSLLLFSSASGLVGCGDLINRRSTDPCEGPQQLPERWLNDREVEAYWRKDRTNLTLCRDKVEFLNGRKARGV